MENIHTGNKVTIQQVNEQIAKSPLVVLDFTASWCGPCQLLAPLIKNLASHLSHIDFYKVDVSDPNGAELSDDYEIGCLPTLCLLYQGELVYRQEGYNPNNNNLAELFGKYLAKYDSSQNDSPESMTHRVSKYLQTKLELPTGDSLDEPVATGQESDNDSLSEMVQRHVASPQEDDETSNHSSNLAIGQ